MLLTIDQLQYITYNKLFTVHYIQTMQSFLFFVKFNETIREKGEG